jgi:acyl-CoA synthetase
MTSIHNVMVDPPADVTARYLEERWWDGSTLQGLLDVGLRACGRARFRVQSAVRPYDGTIAQVTLVAARVAGGLRRSGLQDGDVVAFQLPNWMEAAASFWGSAAAGATLVPIPHSYGRHEARHILRQTKARAVIIADRFGDRNYLNEYEALRPELPDLERVVVVGDATSLPTWACAFSLMTNGSPHQGRAAQPEDPAVIAYTSGTGANPKGVVLSHRALAFEVASHMVPLSRGRKPTLNGSPVTHMAGMLLSLLVPSMLNQDIHLIDKWDPGVVLEASRRLDLTAAAGAAIFLTSVIDHPDFRPADVAGHLPRVFLGGSTVPEALVERANALGIWVGRSYGSTEHPTICNSRNDDSLEKRLTTNGRPVVGVEVKFVDSDGNVVPTGTPGELLSRGPDRCSGYLDPATTAEAIDSQGWLHTGDIGFFDADGHIHISDRLKDIIIRGGENISAAEVEEQLLKYPGIAEVAVVAAPDRRYGERPCAFVRTKPGAAVPSLADLRNHLAEMGLSRQKWPEDLRTIDELPRTPSGKIKKAILRERLRHEHD